MDDRDLLARNLRGLAETLRLIAAHAGTVIELDGAAGGIVATAPAYPWLNAIVLEPTAGAEAILERAAPLSGLAVWTCTPDQAKSARALGWTVVVGRVPAMAMELKHAADLDDDSVPITPAEAGAVSDVGYGNAHGEVERTLAHLPADAVTARGHRDPDGVVTAAAVFLDVDTDCSVQYVATRPEAQRRGHAAALLLAGLARAHGRGCTTTTLQSSDAGVRLYERLGYRTVGELELLARPQCRARVNS